MELTIDQNCPSCGASIVLQEDDRLIRCTYCDVRNYRLESAAGRYLLPGKFPANLDDSAMFYTPYLRFKGSIFYVHGAEVKHKIVDTSRLGIEADNIPISLGLRPQAMRLSPVVSKVAGSFIRQTVPTKSVFAQAAMVTELFGERRDRSVYHRAFIGETISLIYQPCYVRAGSIFDAVDYQLLCNEKLFENHLAVAGPGKASWEPRFISTLCPKCGGPLAGERDSRVLDCPNCETYWQESEGRFQSLAWQTVESAESTARYLPFWRINFSTKGWCLKSYGDYLRLANPPIVFGDRFDATPLSFLIPAFKINPKAFLQVAAQLTVSQWKLPEGKKCRVGNGYPVNLGQNEAIEAVKSVLAATIANKRERLPMLPEMVVEAQQCKLLYLPFIEQPHDLIQEHTMATILSAALRYGRSL